MRMTPARIYAKGRHKLPRVKNRTELDYANYLELLRHAGEVIWYRYEGVKLRIGEGAYFTPDFFVMVKSGELEAHEVKGFWREAARARIKVAAEMYPFRFIAVKQNGKGWEREIFE